MNLEKLDAQIAKLEQLRKLLSDPMMARLALEVLSENRQLPDVVSVLGRPNSIARNALKALEAIDGKFTAQELKDRMLQSGFKLKAKNPMIGVQRVLRDFVKEGVVEMAEEGSGRKPHLYTKKTK